MASGRLDERLEWRDDIDEASDEVLSPSDADTTAELVAWAVVATRDAAARAKLRCTRFEGVMRVLPLGSGIKTPQIMPPLIEMTWPLM
jgi:hypothetical protein